MFDLKMATGDPGAILDQGRDPCEGEALGFAFPRPARFQKEREAIGSRRSGDDGLFGKRPACTMIGSLNEFGFCTSAFAWPSAWQRAEAEILGVLTGRAFQES